MKYKEQMQDSRWKDRREEILKRDNHVCQQCNGVFGGSLQVHHLVYLSGFMAWEYQDKHLITLCIHCHQYWHKYKKDIDILLAISSDKLAQYYRILNELKGTDSEVLLKFVDHILYLKKNKIGGNNG